jgi:hypothetical protein
MKCIIAGTRTLTNYQVVLDAIAKSQFEITEVVSGGALGVDTLGEQWARENKVTIVTFPPKWSVFGKSAGPIRNAQMADYAEALIAVWDGVSKGTKNMIEAATAKNLKVYVHLINQEGEDESRQD